MNYIGLIISGTRGSGKTEITRKLCEQLPIFEQCKSVTTREGRPDDRGEYVYISEEDFTTHRTAGELLTDVNYGSKNYGILSTSIQTIIDTKKIPILVIAPKCVKKVSRQQYLSVFIDSDDILLESRLRGRTGYNKIQEDIQRTEDRTFEKDAQYSIKNNENIADIVDLILYFWEFKNSGGLVPKKGIELLIKGGLLLKNAELGEIKGASYDLHLGKEFYQNEKRDLLSEEKPFLNIEAGDYAIISMKESAIFPKDIAARYDVTVGLFMQGIILSNGPQVDPGFSGGLFCLLYNASNQYVKVKKDQHVATIEFIKLLEPTIPYQGPYQNKERIWEYLQDDKRKGVYTSIKDEISSINTKISNLEKEQWVFKILPTLVAILAIAVAIIIFLLKNNSTSGG
jgi:guanylate kinase/deoxycytidine triphosphate deaminase